MDMKKVKILLEIKLTDNTDNIYILQKRAAIYVTPFPGLIIDDNDNYKKNELSIKLNQVVVKKVRCQMVLPIFMCYCEEKQFESSEKLQLYKRLLHRLRWTNAGPHG